MDMHMPTSCWGRAVPTPILNRPWVFATRLLFLLNARSFLQPIIVRCRSSGESAADTAFDRRPDRAAGAGHHPTVRFRVPVGERKTRGSIVIGGGQVAPGRLVQPVHEKAVVYRVGMFVEKEENLRRIDQFGGLEELHISRVEPVG